MPHILGLDIGSNSVGSAWVDTDSNTVTLGAGVFPAGVKQNDKERGAPKNQARRGSRSQRVNTRRRSERKRDIRRFLQKQGWIPKDLKERKSWEEMNPWLLRRDGLERELTPHEFGRVLLHMAKHRGALGVDVGEDEGEKEKTDRQKEQGKVKKSMDALRQAMERDGAKTYGAFMADLFGHESEAIKGKKATEVRKPIRNRNDATGSPVYRFCPSRDLLREEFAKLWDKQRQFTGELARQLTDEVRERLDKPKGDGTWRHRGLLFGQRQTYWDAGTIGHCDLEPTDLCCPLPDMYAQEFRLLESVNNVRITPLGGVARPLRADEREKVIDALRRQKTGSEATVRRALGINRGEAKTRYTLNLKRDSGKGLNTDWFYREIVRGVFGEQQWDKLSERMRKSINRAILKFDPTIETDYEKVKAGCRKWWGLDEEKTERFLSAWKSRPNVDRRVKLSRRAIRNLLPYLREGLEVMEARKRFAEDPHSGADELQRKRYIPGGHTPSRTLRRFLKKHPNELPPAPMMTNPVVRRAIHEVRRHVQAHIRRAGRKPDRVVVELTRDARLPAVVRDAELKRNRDREALRKSVVEQHGLENKTRSQRQKAIDRVLLCRQQKELCAYSDPDRVITEETAADGTEVEIDHIVPRSRGGGNGLINKVLCFTAANRGKGNQTPIEWLSEDAFAAMEQRFSHWAKEEPAKWAMLHRDAPDIGQFTDSQLTDTAYASKEVVAWLNDALYADKADDKRRVLCTKGSYTALLRRDWGLFLDEQAGRKTRDDHRHHALDALVVALTPQYLPRVAKSMAAVEQARAQGFAQPRREPVPPPWGDSDSFRAQIIDQAKKLVVSHRPQRRKLAGWLHKETQCGPIPGSDNLFTQRIPLAWLKSSHLRVPDGWEELGVQLRQASTKAKKRKIRSQMLALPDKKPAKSGVVRDRWFREEIRQALRDKGLDPDQLTEAQSRQLAREDVLRLPSGVPVRRVTLLKTFSRAVRIPGRHYDSETGKQVIERDPRRVRVYESQNNHHIEIRCDEKDAWRGTIVTAFEAAGRVCPPSRSGRLPRPAVDRGDNEQGCFVMSLSIGEMLYMKDPDTDDVGYYVVFKIDKEGVHLFPHHDAGGDRRAQDAPRRRELRPLSPIQLQALGVAPHQTPMKVWVGPLGEVKVLHRD